MIYAVVLAAGASERMGGQPKALLRTPEGRSYLQSITDAAKAGGASGVVVVVGPPHGDKIRKSLPAGVAPTINPKPDRGMLSSVQAGIAALPYNALGALVWPVDIPYVRPETVRALLASAGNKIVIPTHKGQGGHPVRIPRARFGELASLDPDAGLKALIDARPDQVERMEVEDRGVLVDVDTPEDHERGLSTPAPAAAVAEKKAPAKK
jgi:molybdenum cofactor cytidylyltransferase